MPTLTDEDLGLSSSTGGLSDADLGLDTAVLSQTQMSEAANAIPMPGYTTPFGQDINRTAQARLQQPLQPSEMVKRAGQLEPMAPLMPPPVTPALGGEWEGFAPPPAEPDPTWKTFPEEFAKARHETFQSFSPSPEAVRKAIASGVLTPEEITAMEAKPVGVLPQMAAGAIHSLVNATEEQTKPENLALLLAGGLPGKLGKAAMGLFYADMVRHSPQVFNKVVDALQSGDVQQEAEALTDAVIHGAFLGLTGAHTANTVREGVDSFIKNNGPEARRAHYEQMRLAKQKADLAPITQPESFTQPIKPQENINARPNTSPGQVHATLPASAEPRLQEVPVKEDSQGIQQPPQPTEAPQAEISLRPAIRGQGQIVEGTLGKSHGDLITDATKSGDPNKMMAAIAGANEGRGFVDQNGKFYTRKEAEAMMREQHGDFEMMKPAEGLHSEDLNAQGQPKTQKAAAVEPAKVAEGVDTSNVKGKLTEEEQKTADKALPWADFKEPMPASPHYPIIIETKNGLRYPAYMSDFYDMREVGGKLAPGIAKVVESGPGDIGLSHGILGEGEKIVAGEYPKTPEAYQAAKAAGVKPPRTLGETPKPKSALATETPQTQSEAPLPADVAPAYEHGHAVASNVPGLLIDPFGFQAAKIVGKAAKDLYDSPAVKKARQDAEDLWNAAALKSAPKLTRSNRQLGEAGVRYASSFMVGRTKGQIFADKVLADSGIDPVKFGTALAEDNLRSIRAARDPAQAAKVRTLVGDETSPFKTEAEYQTFLNDPATKAAIERHQQLWAEQKDPLYRQANDLDPDLPLETRGMQTGARINLKALQPGEAGVAPIGQRAPGFRQLATLKRRDPFGRQAKGSGLAYEGNYHEIMANGFERELPVAAQHEFLKQLIDNRDAVVTDKMVEPELELKGEGTAKGYLLTLKPYTGKFIHVRKGLADEFEAISGLDKPLKLPIITAFNNFMTRQSVAGLAEGATHASNLMTQIFTMPGPTGNPMLNALLKSVGRADLLVSVPRVFIKAFTNQRERMLELAEIGATKEPYPGAIAKKLLNPIDQGVRLVSDDVFKALAKKGIVEGTETNRREFINQVGQYNKRLQPLLTRKLRETGLQPFITAAQTFNAQGARRLAMGPGAKATTNARALALKADVAAGWIGGIVLVTALNLLLSKKATGPAGTPLGSVGWVGDDQKVHTFNVFRLLGYERGARITGLGPYIEAKRQGLSSGQALTSGAQSVASTGLGMAMGPGPRFAMVAGTGQRPTQPWVREAPKVPPGDTLSPLKSQIAKNIQTAMIEANPILSSVAEVRKEVKQGKPLSEALVGGAQKQLTRYSPQTRMSEQKAAALPKIVDSAQLRDYVDDVVKEARQLPMRERQHFINQKFRDDELGRKYRDTAWQQIERKGVLKYK